MKLQTSGLRFEDHPGEWRRRQGIVGVAAPDIGVDASEPNLLQVFPWIEIPEHGCEGAALVIDRERVAGASHVIQ